MAVVMPAHNEAEGLPGFLDEIVSTLAGRWEKLTVIVVDDASTDGTAERARSVSADDVDIEVIRRSTNSGHGPTALAAYRSALERGADRVLHVDGDGQFLAAEFPALIDALAHGDAARGIRIARDDPWYRRLLSSAVASGLAVLTRRRVVDPNSPLRAYRPDALVQLLDIVPPGASVPHIWFSILEAREAVAVKTISVTSLPRRGGDANGTMFGGSSLARLLPNKRLIRFVGRALLEVFGRRGPLRAPVSLRWERRMTR